MKWAFFLFLLINQFAKKLPVLFNKDKVEVRYDLFPCIINEFFLRGYLLFS